MAFMLNACYIKLVFFGYYPAFAMSINIKLKLKAKAIKRERKRQKSPKTYKYSARFSSLLCQLKYGYFAEQFPN
jgi:hypothetical protein